MLINRASLSQTVDAIDAGGGGGGHGGSNAVTPHGDNRGPAARACGGTFAGFPFRTFRGIWLVYGERIASHSARHIHEEASRALGQLRVQDKVARALDSADGGWMGAWSAQPGGREMPILAIFCCGKCSVGLWRNLPRRRPQSTRKAAFDVVHQRRRWIRDGERGSRRIPPSGTRCSPSAK